MNTYQIDTLIQVSTTFTDLTGALADPTSIFCYVVDPNGVTTEYSGGQITRDSEGIYHVQITPSVSGYWRYKWQGTGALVASSADTSFYVQPSAMIRG
jgi:hypothetical protein